jgi:PAS domain S-box-containing protein
VAAYWTRPTWPASSPTVPLGFGIPIHVPDYPNWPHANATALDGHVRSALAVPLRVADRTIGALSIRYHTPHTCSPEQIEVLVLLAAQVAPALEAARLHAHAQRQILEREVAEAALRQSERRKGAIVEAALDCIIAVDHAGLISEFNPAAERTFGYNRANVIGRALQDIITPLLLRKANGARMAEYLISGTGTGLDHRLETVMLRVDGTEFPAELAIVRTESGDRQRRRGHRGPGLRAALHRVESVHGATHPVPRLGGAGQAEIRVPTAAIAPSCDPPSTWPTTWVCEWFRQPGAAAPPPWRQVS